jgi:16S rRNA (guanine966-N2)-methyltransferase
MRIITGKHKGRKLKLSTKNKKVDFRPTTDFLRETLFNIINNKIIDATFLDVYAGCGSVGLEAISRGAKSVMFIEKNRDIAEIIKENLLMIHEKANIISKDAISAVNQLSETFDIIFIDPPYFENKENITVETVINSKICNPGGLIILQHHRSVKLVISPADSRRYGTNFLSFYDV